MSQVDFFGLEGGFRHVGFGVPEICFDEVLDRNRGRSLSLFLAKRFPAQDEVADIFVRRN